MKKTGLMFGLFVGILLLATACGNKLVYPESEHSVPSAVLTQGAQQGYFVTFTPTPTPKVEEGTTPTPEETPTPTLSPTPEYTPTPTLTEPPGVTFTPVPTEVVSYTDITTQYNNNKSSIRDKEATIASEKKYACINIVTLNNTGITSKEYINAWVDVFNCDTDQQVSAAAQVKIRGNSTASESDIKPYRIKFEKKQSMLGLHDGKKYRSWVLLRTYWNFCPDYLAFRLGSVILGDNYYVSDATYVNVYVDGKYAGLYLLCEQTQVNKGRIEVNEPKEGNTSVRVGYMLEVNNYAARENNPYFSMKYGGYTVKDIVGTSRVLHSAHISIDSDTYSTAQTDFIEKYTKNAFEILYQACEKNTAMMFDENYDLVDASGVYTPQQAVEAVFDLESLAGMLILEELCHDYDVGEGSFYMCVDFSDDAKYKKLTFMAPWDFDWAFYGESDGGYYACTHQDNPLKGDHSNAWFIVAMKAGWFQDIVKAKWKTLSDSGVLTQVCEDVKTYITGVNEDLPSGSKPSVGSGRAICNFVKGRIEWLDKKWK